MLGFGAICQRPGVTMKARISKAGAAGSMPMRPRSRVNTLPIVCKMHVPSDRYTFTNLLQNNVTHANHAVYLQLVVVATP